MPKLVDYDPGNNMSKAMDNAETLAAIGVEPTNNMRNAEAQQLADVEYDSGNNMAKANMGHAEAQKVGCHRSRSR